MVRLVGHWRAVILQGLLALSAGMTHATEVTFLTLEYPPYTSEFMQGDGGMIRLLRTALEGTDWKVKVIFLPWSRAHLDIAEGHADGVLPLWPQEVIDFKVTPTKPIFESKLGFFVRKEDYARIDVDINRMIGKSVCTVRTYGYPDVFVKSGVLRDDGNDDEGSLKKLAAKRCDYAAMESAVGKFIISKDKPWSLDAQVAWKEPAFVSLPLHIGIVPGRPSSARLLVDIEAGIARMKKDHRFQTLVDELYGDVPKPLKKTK